MAIMKSANEWLKDPAVKDKPDEVIEVVTPNGWSRDDGVTMDDPISLQDFWKRLNESTIIGRRA